LSGYQISRDDFKSGLPKIRNGAPKDGVDVRVGLPKFRKVNIIGYQRFQF
jgi:hypothetical protein